MVWGKVLGGTIGAFVAGPLGAGVGAGLGSLFDGSDDEKSSKGTDAPESPFRVNDLSVVHHRRGPSGPGLVLVSTVVAERE